MERATTFPIIVDAHRKAQSKTGSVGSYSANGAVIHRKKTTRKASLVVGGSADRHSARSVRPTLPLFHWSLRLFLTKPWKQQCNDKRGQSGVIVCLSFAVVASFRAKVISIETWCTGLVANRNQPGGDQQRPSPLAHHARSNCAEEDHGIPRPLQSLPVHLTNY